MLPIFAHQPDTQQHGKQIMRVLVTGANGRLGSQLVHELQHRDHTVLGVDVDTVDITNRDSVNHTFEAFQPEIVIHCAALTAVDYCAEHPDEALEINGFGAQTVALACQASDTVLVQISTNEVFDGKTQRPYLEYDRPNPINPYAYSKWVGEQIVRDLVRRHYIVRTSWLFAHGGGNFVYTILQQARQGHPLRVVTNEVASPTYSNDLAAAIGQLITTGCYGIYHLINEGYTSRYAFARYALDQAGYVDTPVEPIALAEYPRASRPPEYTMLRNMAAARLGITLRSWQEALAAFFKAEGITLP
jgi:dTDP-4-dehydrorhamnose reductase